MATSVKTIMIPFIFVVLPKSSKKTTRQKDSIDDFVPQESIDLKFLGETGKDIEDGPASSQHSSEGSERFSTCIFSKNVVVYYCKCCNLRYWLSIRQ